MVFFQMRVELTEQFGSLLADYIPFPIGDFVEEVFCRLNNQSLAEYIFIFNKRTNQLTDFLNI